MEELFIALGVLGLLLSLVINYHDYYYHNSVLNSCSSAEYAEINSEMLHHEAHKQHEIEMSGNSSIHGIALSSRPEDD